MAASDNINRNQIPGHHIDAIRSAIEHHGSQGITFSPRSTDFTDESGKTHRVPVDRRGGRMFNVDLTDPKNSAYLQHLPSEGLGTSLSVAEGKISLGDSTIRQGKPGLADSMRTAQLKAADRADKETAYYRSSRPISMFNDINEMSMREEGDRSHIIYVNVSNDEELSHYEYDTKTGNIGPFIVSDRDAFSYDKSNLSVARSEQSRLGLPGKHLRSFER